MTVLMRGGIIIEYDLYCKVFIDTNIDYDDLFNMVLNCVNGRKEAVSYIASDWCVICVKANDEYSLERYLYDTTNFLYWRYYLDIEPCLNNEDISNYINRISKFLKLLRLNNIELVLAGDFENEITASADDKI